MNHERVIEGGAGDLEVRWSEPACPPRFGCVVAHPHPLHGGTMDNSTTGVLADRLVAAGGLVLRFNFRGVGHSAGSFDHGRGEIEDLLAAERHLGEARPDLPLWLAGYSFGAAMILLRAAQAGRTRERAGSLSKLLALAPPVEHYDLSVLETSTIPLILVCGERDQLTPRHAVEHLAGRWPGTRDTLWLAGQGHDLGAGGDELPSTLDRAIEILQRDQTAADR